MSETRPSADPGHRILQMINTLAERDMREHVLARTDLERELGITMEAQATR